MARNGRVLLIVHDNYQDDNVFPLGAGYLAATLERRDFCITCQKLSVRGRC